MNRCVDGLFPFIACGVVGEYSEAVGAWGESESCVQFAAGRFSEFFCAVDPHFHPLQRAGDVGGGLNGDR